MQPERSTCRGDHVPEELLALFSNSALFSRDASARTRLHTVTATLAPLIGDELCAATVGPWIRGGDDKEGAGQGQRQGGRHQEGCGERDGGGGGADAAGSGSGLDGTGGGAEAAAAPGAAAAPEAAAAPIAAAAAASATAAAWCGRRRRHQYRKHQHLKHSRGDCEQRRDRGLTGVVHGFCVARRLSERRD